MISCCQFYQEESDLFKRYSDNMINNQISIFNCSMNDKEYTCDISSWDWNRACLQSWMWYLYLLLRSFTWEYHQKNYEIKSSSSKKMIDEWLLLNAELKKKTMKNLIIMKKEKNYKVIISKKNKLTQNYYFDYFNKVSKRKKELITFCN